MVEAENDFCGVRYGDIPDGSLELSCGKLLNELGVTIAEFPAPPGVDTPMLGDSLLRMREAGGATLEAPRPQSSVHCGTGALHRARRPP